MTPQKRFAANLRRARKERRISQEELGNRCDLHRTEISLLERAGREPRLGTLLKLAGSLGVQPATLMEGMAWDADAQRFRVEAPPEA